MPEPTLEIVPKKYGGETTVLSVRIPKSMVKDLDEVAAKSGRNRNEIMLLSLEFALEHMVVKEK